MTISAQDAHPWPIWKGRYRVNFPIFDATGSLVPGATGLDSEVSINEGTFVDCTNEAVEIAAASGIYYLDLVSTEIDSSSTVLQVKSNGKTTVIVLNPLKFPIVRTGTAQAGGATTITLDAAASAIDDYYLNAYIRITNNSPANVLGQTRQITDYVGSTKVATVFPWGTNPSVASTFEIIVPFGVICAAGVDQQTADKIADHILRRPFSVAKASADGDALGGLTGSGAKLRTLLGVIAKMTNKVGPAAGGILPIYEEDDATTFGSQTLTTSPTAEPVTSVDTV